MKTNDIEAILEGLRKKYLGALPAKLETLETFWRASDLMHVKGEFHKFKGTGLTYGFPEISELGRIGEWICEKRPEILHEGFALTLELLKWSLEARQSGKTPELAPDARFQRLQAIAQEPTQLP